MRPELTAPCPTCGAGAGARCRTLGTKRVIFKPHSDRVPDVEGAFKALAEAAEGRRLPCRDGVAWTSEDPRWRWAAALGCGGCPVLVECGAAGDAAGAGYVWGGVDRGC